MSTEMLPPLLGGCRWISALPDDGAVETESLATVIGFESLRIFWLSGIPPGQRRGNHAHRESILATFVLTGKCSLTLDDGHERQSVVLIGSGPGLVIGPWIWHDLYDFAPGTSVAVVASTRYDEREYIRDYDTFLREVATRD